MPVNRGKQFEDKFKQDMLKIEGISVDRIYDVVSGYKTISNICDFIVYKYPNIYYSECKSHLGNTFPLSKLTQYDKLVQKVGIKGVRTGVFIWFRDHQKVIYVPIKTITKMKQDGKKSVNITTIDKDGYRYYDVPSVQLRVFMDSDYSGLFDWAQEGD